MQFAIGGLASSFAEVVTLPVDTVKVRMQLSGTQQYAYRNSWHCASSIVSNEGAKGLYKGMSAAILRQMFYSGSRIALYTPIRNFLLHNSNESNYAGLYAAGAFAGALGAMVGVPFDAAKTRLQSDKTGKVYGNSTRRALSSAYAQGWRGLFVGTLPTVQRSMVVNGVELGTYDMAKRLVVSSSDDFHEDSAVTHFLCSTISGFFTAVAAAPVDILKTRLMQQNPKEPLKYRGMVHCAKAAIQNEGFFSLWKGVLPLWLRLGPWVTCFFLASEQLRLLVEPKTSA
ncbi:MAG: hypothetical protein MHM6MM_008348 [Cercozoa sp. M6MM]